MRPRPSLFGALTGMVILRERGGPSRLARRQVLIAGVILLSGG